jgi:hypothetical protein
MASSNGSLLSEKRPVTLAELTAEGGRAELSLLRRRRLLLECVPKLGHPPEMVFMLPLMRCA